MPCAKRQVALRAEHDGDDHRYLHAILKETGELEFEGHDLGPGTAAISSDGEYEWTCTYAAADVPRVLSLLGGASSDDILAYLKAHYSDGASHDLEKKLRECDIPRGFHNWSG